MKSLILLVLITTLSISASLARGPAVEDFVGIENEQPDVTPEGTEALFNFDKDVQAQAVIVKKATAPAPDQQSPWPLSAWFGVLIILAMPVVTWMLTMGHLKKQAAEAKSEVVNNVTPLPVRSRSEEKDDIKKAS
jgi:hypothetical protein